MTKTTMRNTMITVAGLALIFAPAAWAQCSSSTKTASYSKDHNIVETAVAAGDFKTLAAALEAAGLVDALQGEGPFTVFAPTDEAFSKLPEGTVETLLKPENRDQLVAILKYHVVAGKMPASKVTKAAGATTLMGQRIDFTTKGSNVMVDGARVTKADIKASNGVIHVIDTVILPADANIVKTAQSTEKFNTLLTAATEAGLADTLANGGPFTVFAPTDDAFAKLPAGTVENLLKPENRDQLVAILKHHVVSGRVYSDQAIEAGKAETLSGGNVYIKAKGGNVMINDARVMTADIDASNGVIHVVDTVILPDARTAHGEYDGRAG